MTFEKSEETPKQAPRPASSTIHINSNSRIGERVITNIVAEALKEKGFTNVDVRKSHGETHVVKNGMEPLSDDPTTVMDALIARNPSFMNSRVTVQPNGYHYGGDIPPDSEYPAAGLPIVGYKTAQYADTNIIAVDEKGGEQYIAHANSPEVAKALIQVLEKSDVKIPVDAIQAPF
jgi:hypothetical protein